MLTPTIIQGGCTSDEVEECQEISPAQYFSELVWLLKKQEDTIFWREWINNRVLCAKIDEMVDLLWDKNRKTEALRFLSSFGTLPNIGKREIEIFLNELQGLESIARDVNEDESILGIDKPVSYKKVEILRKLFVAFWVAKSESIGWELQKPTNLILKVYEGHIVDRFYGRTGMIDFDKFLDYDDLNSLEGIMFFWLRKNSDSTEVWELINEVTGTIEEIHWTNMWDKWEVTDKSDASRKSKKQIWAHNRRMRAKEMKGQKTQEQLRKEKERKYEEKIQELKSYWEQVKSELQRLQGFLLTHIPYVTEVLDYLHLDHRLRQEWYLEEWGNIWDVRGQILGTIEWLESDCSILRSTIHTLEAGISRLSLNLIQINSDWSNNWAEAKALQKTLDKKTARIDKEKNRLKEVEAERQRISDNVEDIISQLEGFRFKHWVPNVDEFEAWIYYSLDAADMYSMTERINRPPVTVQWIEQNILHIFRKILWRYFEWNDISIVDIWDLLEKIDNLESKYHEDTSIPEIEIIDLGNISGFIDTLLAIIPQKYIDEIPVFGNWKFKLITPKLFILNPPKIEQQKPKIDHGRKRKKEAKNKRDAILDEKIKLRNEISIVEEEMMQYIQYWNNKLKMVFRKKRSIISDINNIKNHVWWRNKHRGKSAEELEALLQNINSEFEEAQKMKENTTLLQDQGRYDALENQRWTLQRKLQNLK